MTDSLTMEQIVKAGLAFNPLDSEDGQGVLYVAENQNRLTEAMRENGWRDPRFVTKDQVANEGWSVVAGAKPVEVLWREDAGQWQSEKVFNAAQVKGIDSLEAMRQRARATLEDGDLVVSGVSRQPEVENSYYLLVGSSRFVAGDVKYGIGAISTESEIIEYARDDCLEEGTTLEASAGERRDGTAIMLKEDFAPGEEFETAIRRLRGGGRSFEIFNSKTEEAAFIARAKELGFGVDEQKEVGVDEKKLEDEIAQESDKVTLEGDEVVMTPMLRVQDHDQVLDQRVTPEYVANAVLGRVFKENVPGSGEYFRTGGKKPAFVDKGDSLVVKDKKPDSYQAVLELAKKKGWEQIELSGKPENVAKVWLEAQLMGIKVANYVPSEKDLAALEVRKEKLALEVQERAAAAVKVAPMGAKLVDKGMHVGTVVDIVDGFVIQSAGRGKHVAHELGKFDRVPEVGKPLELEYHGGRVRELVKQQEREGRERGGRV